jgi:uncharacterized protein (DUF58 family)
MSPSRFRLFGRRAERVAPAPEELFDEAFQKRLEYLALVARRIFSGRTRAERRSRKAGSGVEFADYRRYYPGDDYRQIDWNVYGRSDRLMLRLQEQEEDLSVYLLLDCSASMGFGAPTKLNYGKQLCAALSYIALNHLDRVSVTALRERVVQRLAPTRGRNRIFTVLEFLRPLRAEGGTDLSDALSAFAAQNKRRGLAILISDLYDPQGFEDGVKRLLYAGFEAHVIHVADPLDRAPNLHGEIELIDAETERSRQVTVTPRLLARYAEAHRAYLDRIRSFCLQRRVGLSMADTATPADETVLRLLRKGSLLA